MKKRKFSFARLYKLIKVFVWLITIVFLIISLFNLGQGALARYLGRDNYCSKITNVASTFDLEGFRYEASKAGYSGGEVDIFLAQKNAELIDECKMNYTRNIRSHVDMFLYFLALSLLVIGSYYLLVYLVGYIFPYKD